MINTIVAQSYAHDLSIRLQLPIFIVLLLVSDAINGMSVGKRLCNIGCVNFKTQQPIGILGSVIRNSLVNLNFLLLPAAINYILYVSYYRRLGDFIANTCLLNLAPTLHHQDPSLY